MIESGLFQLATQTAAINKFLGGPTAFYFSFLPKQPVLPAIVMHRIASMPESDTLDRPTPDYNELMRGRFQFDSFAQDNVNPALVSDSGYLCAAALSRALRSQLKSLVSSVLPDGTLIANYDIQDEFDADFEVGGTGYLYRRVLDVMLWFQETA